MPRKSPPDGMIGVCCGHIVPRIPVVVERPARRNVYWCEECQMHRMSGGKSTGLRAFDFAFRLRDAIEQNPEPIVVDDPGTDHGRRLVLAFGAQIRSLA